jgi:hypothetical protein
MFDLLALLGRDFVAGGPNRGENVAVLAFLLRQLQEVIDLCELAYLLQ